MTKHLETLIDDLVKAVDNDIWKQRYSKKNAEDEDAVENARDALRDILEEYVESYEFLQMLYKAGVEDWDDYDDAVAAFGRPLYHE